MKVAVASGKGGTGKTTVAVNLALSVPGAHLVDCDVEAPNCHLLLGMAPQPIAEVTMSSPAIDDDLCILCGDCASFCQFNALAVLPDRVLTFEHLCHACGGCALVCPVDAISERPRVVGHVQRAQQADLVLHQGLLEIGQASAVAVIAAVRSEAERAHQSGLLICPSGEVDRWLQIWQYQKARQPHRTTATSLRTNGYADEAIKTLWDILAPLSDYAFKRPTRRVRAGVVLDCPPGGELPGRVHGRTAHLCQGKYKSAIHLNECRRMGVKVLPPMSMSPSRISPDEAATSGSGSRRSATLGAPRCR